MIIGRELERSAMQFRHGGYHAESKPHPFPCRGWNPRDKTARTTRSLSRIRYSRTVIGHRDLHGTVAANGRFHRDIAIDRRIFDRVIDQVGNGLGQEGTDAPFTASPVR